YRYSLRYNDNMVLAPQWEVQTNLFQRKAYFKFIPFQNHDNMEITLAHGQISQGIAWTPFLGDGPQPQKHELPKQSFATVHDVGFWIDLTRTNIPALVEEPFMPPFQRFFLSRTCRSRKYARFMLSWAHLKIWITFLNAANKKLKPSSSES